MKKVVLVILLLLFTRCASNPLKNISTEGLTYKETGIYYMGELCATLSAVEISYDNKKIVREVTFVLTSSKFNDKALQIIKLVNLSNPNIEVEVELKPINNSLRKSGETTPSSYIDKYK